MLSLIIFILSIHWVGDFILQPYNISSTKHKDFSALIKHSLLYTATWFSALILLAAISSSLNIYSLLNIIYFSGITLFTHAVIDYYTSKTNNILYNNKQYYEFFVSIGFDQLLHLIQLFITFKLLL